MFISSFSVVKNHSQEQNYQSLFWKGCTSTIIWVYPYMCKKNYFVLYLDVATIQANKWPTSCEESPFDWNIGLV
jgi:hypothetical protein